jgi:structural maintenance of chromosome 2
MADESSTDLLSLPEQLALLEKKMRESQSLIRQGALKSEHIKKSLKSLQTASKEEEELHKSILEDEELIKKEISTIEKKYSNLSYDPNQESSLRSRLNELNSNLGSIKDVIDSLMVKLEAQLKFYFKDPEKNFDRSRVKGLVAKLVHVNDKRMSTALEITAGGRLHHVIVDNENTGKLLLQKGDLKKRVTILPLNKISNRMTDPNKVKNAKTIAQSRGCTANLAIELIGYDEEVKRAMEHVFGSTIICDSSDVANEICKTVKNRTVSLAGDSYDPSGKITFIVIILKILFIYFNI